MAVGFLAMDATDNAVSARPKWHTPILSLGYMACVLGIGLLLYDVCLRH